MYGSFLVLRTDGTGLTTGQLTEYISYFFTLIWSVMALSRFIQIQSQAKASATRIAKFLDEELEIKDLEELFISQQVHIRILIFQIGNFLIYILD